MVGPGPKHDAGLRPALPPPLRFVTDEGTEILLNLPEAVHIRGGDALALEDGSLVEVRAADEALLEVTAPTPDALIRFAFCGCRPLCKKFLNH